MRKDYYDMTDKEKLIYVLEDIGISLLFNEPTGGEPVSASTDNDYEVEFSFNQSGDFVSFVAY